MELELIDLGEKKKSIANDCLSACISILEHGCINPSRMCASCKDRNRCGIAVKFAHDALCGVMGLNDNIGHDQWYHIKQWQKEYHKINPNPAIY